MDSLVIAIDEHGNTGYGCDDETALKQYHDDFGDDAAPLRLIKIELHNARPKTMTLTATLPDEPKAELVVEGS